jgi:hypothetical protein
MADDDTDSVFGFIIFILFLALLGFAAGGGGASSTAGTTTTKTTTTPGTTSTVTPNTSSSNIPGGPLSHCPGKVISSKTKNGPNGSINLKVYFSSNADRNCAEATVFDWADKTQGRLTVRLRFSDYTGTSWPEYAVRSIKPHPTRVTGVYLNDSYNRCISASATFTPYTGMDPLRVRSGPMGCN